MLETALEGRMFADWLWETIGKQRKSVAIQTEEISFTYSELAKMLQAVGTVLRKEGLQQSDRVVLYFEEKLPLIICHLGIVLAGGISLPLNPRFTRYEMLYFLRDSEAKFAISSGKQAFLLNSLKSEAPNLKVVVEPWELIRSPHNDRIIPNIKPDDPALILYSSGTTGESKGTVHTHQTLASALRALQKCWQFTPQDTLLNVLPLFHIHGLSFASHLALATGCHMILSKHFHPSKTMNQMKEATVFYGIPPFYYAFLRRPDFRIMAKGWKNIRLFTCGSAPIRPEVLPELERILSQPIINRYGMTESHVITSLPLDGKAKQGSVGLLLEGLKMKLVDNQGKSVSTNTVGEVLVRGPNLFTEYWKKPDITREAFNNEGWFATGDLGFLDEDGYLTLRGRKNDLIIVSGYNVYPPAVEQVLNSCPGVRESAVVGIPDPRKGERVVAFVVADERTLREAEVKSYCAERLVDYQRPWRIISLDSLPRNTMGKVLKAELRERLSKELA